MARIIILDSFPASCLGKARSTPPTLTDRCRQWIMDCIVRGHRILIPAIVYYEVLRELERLSAASQIARLQQFCFSRPERFIELQTTHLETAGRLWAQSRNAGTPTADAQALDGDAILAAQALHFAQSLGASSDEYVIATTNIGHLRQFAPAELWMDIPPGS